MRDACCWRVSALSTGTQFDGPANPRASGMVGVCDGHHRFPGALVERNIETMNMIKPDPGDPVRSIQLVRRKDVSMARQRRRRWPCAILVEGENRVRITSTWRRGTSDVRALPRSPAMRGGRQGEGSAAAVEVGPDIGRDPLPPGCGGVEMVTTRALVERNAETMNMIKPDPGDPVRSIVEVPTTAEDPCGRGSSDHIDLNVPRRRRRSALPWKLDLFTDLGTRAPCAPERRCA